MERQGLQLSHGPPGAYLEPHRGCSGCLLHLCSVVLPEHFSEAVFLVAAFPLPRGSFSEGFLGISPFQNNFFVAAPSRRQPIRVGWAPPGRKTTRACPPRSSRMTECRSGAGVGTRKSNMGFRAAGLRIENFLFTRPWQAILSGPLFGREGLKLDVYRVLVHLGASAGLERAWRSKMGFRATGLRLENLSTRLRAQIV